MWCNYEFILRPESDIESKRSKRTHNAIAIDLIWAADEHLLIYEWLFGQIDGILFFSADAAADVIGKCSH